MKKATVYEISKDDLLKFKHDETEFNVIFKIHNYKSSISVNDFNTYDIFYVHMDMFDNETTIVTILPFRKFEYQLIKCFKEETKEESSNSYFQKFLDIPML